LGHNLKPPFGFFRLCLFVRLKKGALLNFKSIKTSALLIFK
jgi:hypothetical protein